MGGFGVLSCGRRWLPQCFPADSQRVLPVKPRTSLEITYASAFLHLREPALTNGAGTRFVSLLLELWGDNLIMRERPARVNTFVRACFRRVGQTFLSAAFGRL